MTSIERIWEAKEYQGLGSDISITAAWAFATRSNDIRTKGIEPKKLFCISALSVFALDTKSLSIFKLNIFILLSRLRVRIQPSSLFHLKPPAQIPLKVPNVEFNFHVSVDSIQLLTDTSKSNLTLGSKL